MASDLWFVMSSLSGVSKCVHSICLVKSVIQYCYEIVSSIHKVNYTYNIPLWLPNNTYIMSIVFDMSVWIAEFSQGPNYT